MEGGGQIRIFRPRIFMSRKVRTSCKMSSAGAFLLQFPSFSGFELVGRSFEKYSDGKS